MYDHLNDELSTLKEQVQARPRKERQLASCREERAEMRERVRQLEAELAHDHHVLQKLHGLSFTHLLVTIRGIEDERDQQLHQQVASLNAKLQSTKLNLSGLEADEQRLVQELQAIQTAETEYKRLLAEKERHIAESDDTELANHLLELAHRLGDIRSQLKETREALDAAQNASNALLNCLTSLDKARNWGTWDMLGGGTIATMVKRGHMDDAQRDMNTANRYVRKLQRELQDVHGIAGDPVDVNPGGFLHFADYFFDDLFVDWAVQNQIKRGIDAVTSQHSAVESLLTQLNTRISSLDHDRVTVEEEKRRLIETAG